jgi:flagellar biosynthesis chaperone FliJ
MAKKPTYPLQQVLEVKRRRVEEAEKIVKQRQKELEREEKKLRDLQRERDKVRTHRDDKLAQLRHALDTGTTAPKARQMKQYLDLVKERLIAEEKKVVEQEKQVAQARRNLEEARALLRKRRLEVDKLQTHQQDWEKQTAKELRIQEGRAEAELGSVMHAHKKRHKG